MSRHALRPRLLTALLLSLTVAATAQTKPAPAPPASAPPPPTHADILRGAYGPYRANNDLLYYHLDIRVDPAAQTITGKNTIRFRMLQDGTPHPDRPQRGPARRQDPPRHNRAEVRARLRRRLHRLPPHPPRRADLLHRLLLLRPPPYHRPLRRHRLHAKTRQAVLWINTACEDDGASIWWPNKDQWRDEVESMDISVAVPSGLIDVSNGKFKGKTDLGDGYTRWDWHVSYPINNYDVSLNIGDYVHFSRSLRHAAPRLLRPPRRPRQGEGPVHAGQRHARRPMSTTSATTPSSATATSSSKSPTPAWSTRPPSPTATTSRTATSAATGPASASASIRLHHRPRERARVVRQQHHRRSDRSDMWIHEGWATYLRITLRRVLLG